jgi:hypothetical protein
MIFMGLGGFRIRDAGRRVAMPLRGVARWLVLSLALGYAIYIVRALVFGVQPQRSLRTDVIQGILVGVALALVTTELLARAKVRKVNGWTTMYGCGVPGNGMLMRAAAYQVFPGPVNVPEEAMYWTTSRDGAGRALDGRRSYVLHFPPGGLPPHEAFWSLTMGDAKNRFVANPLRRYSVGDRSGLVPNADGSLDVLIQRAPPPGGSANWLPAPPGKFTLWLRVYVPGPAILDGSYDVPPVVNKGA